MVTHIMKLSKKKRIEQVEKMIEDMGLKKSKRVCKLVSQVIDKSRLKIIEETLFKKGLISKKDYDRLVDKKLVEYIEKVKETTKLLQKRSEILRKETKYLKKLRKLLGKKKKEKLFYIG